MLLVLVVRLLDVIIADATSDYAIGDYAIIAFVIASQLLLSH